MAYNPSGSELAKIWQVLHEMRGRNQGTQLTTWVINNCGIPHELTVDHARGRLEQHGEVDIVIVGPDRVRAHGTVCNKIATYLTARAAKANGGHAPACATSRSKSATPWQ